MFKKVLRFVGEGTANTLEGLLQDLFLGKKARRGRNGAWKTPKAAKAPRTRRTAYRAHTPATTPRMVVVHIHEGAVVHF